MVQYFTTSGFFPSPHVSSSTLCRYRCRVEVEEEQGLLTVTKEEEEEEEEEEKAEIGRQRVIEEQ